MTKSILLLGGNIGDVAQNMLYAIEKIKSKAGEVIKTSSLYESKSWGFDSKNFINQVIEINTKLDAFMLLKTLQEIELELGRKVKTNINDSNKPQYSDRPIDIDILFYGNSNIHTESLQIPHPQIANRKFTLVPLCQKWGEMQHPTLGCSLNELNKLCTDNGWVKLIE